MVPGLRRRLAARRTALSQTAGEQAVHAAETIVGRAWAEQLLRYYAHMSCSFDTAREQYEAAAGRLIAAQRYGDPSEISMAHAALERALDACRDCEAAREQGRRALEAALDALARTGNRWTVSATVGQAGGDTPVPATSPAPTSGPSIRQSPPGGGESQSKRRALWRVGRLRARRTPDPGKP